MSTATATTTATTTTTTTTTTIAMTRHTDDTAHRHAVEYAVVVLGLDAEPTVTWDLDHHLQGHLDMSGVHLVLIAARTDDHDPRLLTESEWDGLRHGLAAA